MNRTKYWGALLLSLGVAGGCEKEAPPVRTVEVYLAATDLTPGTSLTQKELAPKPMTVDQLRASGWKIDFLPLDVRDLLDRVVRKEVKAGEPVLTTDLYPVKQPGLELVMLVEVRQQPEVLRVKNALEQMAIMAREEQGCLRYDIMAVQAQSTQTGQPVGIAPVFFVFQSWQRRIDYEAHLASATYKRLFDERIKPHLRFTYPLQQLKLD